VRHGCDPRERTNACNTSPQRAGSCLTVHRGASDRRGTREIPSRPTATLDRLYGCTLEAFQKISHLCASLWITGDIAPAAATRQSRTAGARRFVTPHRQAPLASDGPPSIPSSGSLIADRYTTRRLSLTFSPEPGHRPRPKGTPARVPLRWCSTKCHGLPLPWTDSAILCTSGVTSAMELPHCQHHAVSWDATTPTKSPEHRARSCQNRGKLSVSRFPRCSPRGCGVRSARGPQRRSGGWLR